MVEMVGMPLDNVKTHSLHSTYAIRMFAEETPEQFIKKFTGHNSNAFRLYKHTGDKMRQEMSKKSHNHGDVKCMPSSTVSKSLQTQNGNIVYEIEDCKIVEIEGNSTEEKVRKHDELLNVLQCNKRKVACIDGHKGTSDNGQTICEMLKRMIDSKAYKRIRLNIELSDLE